MAPFPIILRRRARRLLLLTALTALIGAVAAWLGVEVYAERQLAAARAALVRYDFAAAHTHAEACVRLWPQRFSYRFLAAQAARRACNYRAAEEHLACCEELAGEANNVGMLERMLLRAQQGQLAAVERALWILVEEHPADKLLILEALTRGYLQHYRLAAADKCLKLLLEEAPDHTEAWLWRGGILELVGNEEEALRCYRQAFELAPDNDTYQLRLALFLVRLNRTPEALPHLEQLGARRPDSADGLVGLAACLLATGDQVRGREVLERALALQPEHVQGLAEKGKLALEGNDLPRAEALLRRAAAAEPSDRAIQYLLHQCLLRSGQTAEAHQQQVHLKVLEKDLARMEQILRSGPGDRRQSPDSFYELGAIFSRHGRPDLGRYWYQQALALNPGHQPTRTALARDREVTGKEP
jgi:tetratricopeptide (TPR) repeat protein